RSAVSRPSPFSHLLARACTTFGGRIGRARTGERGSSPMPQNEEGADRRAAFAALLAHRFGADAPVPPPDLAQAEALLGMAGRRSVRDYDHARPVDSALVRFLCAVALSAPSKSDLQQRDIIILEDAAQRRRVTALIGDRWIDEAPLFLVFCGNNRRQRQLHE